MAGYIKIYRKILDNPIVCKDSDYFAVWCYLLLSASHKPFSAMFGGEKIELMPGQLITGRKSISEKFGISESKVERILKSLKNEQQIEQQTSNKNRLITILNWSEYQGCEQQIEQQVNNNRTTSEQQVNTNKNVKNIKNDKNNITPLNPPRGDAGLKKIIDEYTESDALREALSDFVAMRKKIKKPLSERALKMVLTKLDDLGKDSVAIKKDIVNQSVLHCWHTVYKLHNAADLNVYNDDNVDYDELEKIMQEKM